jgi:50S ribosomal protein L16 3-hydroxylase
VDSYDVFLLQGRGRRRWQVSAQPDHAFVPGLPLRVLQRFVPEAEWVLETGDMLYLPPGIAHHGIAESECLTWSIGFRAPSDAEIVQGFLDFLRDRLAPAGHFTDPGLRPARHPGEIPAAMLRHAARALRAIRWSRATLREFVGCHASEVKPHVFFEAPQRPFTRARFVRAAARRGLVLDARTRLLFSGTMFFINGEAVAVDAAARALVRRLADRRRLEAPLEAPPQFWELAHAWHAQGFLACAGEAP